MALIRPHFGDTLDPVRAFRMGRMETMASSPSSYRSAPVAEGDVLAGKYEVIRVIGAGGMGVVVEARHLQLDQRVALKFLLVDEHPSEDAVGRFLREGRAAAQIKSEHVARVSDVGTLEGGAPFIVMEYLQGEDLSEVIAKRGALGVREAVDYVLQACEAIAEAHALGIIHRDLKPANLFLTRRADGSPLVKVLDFGISKIDNDPRNISLTASTGAVGSPQYMSPEQMRSAKHVDRRTDIWALGAILFELLAGRPPFEADSLIALCTLVATREAPLLRGIREDAPEDLERIVSRCLQKDPNNRYQTLAEMAVDLAPFGSRTAQTSARRIVTILNEVGLAGSAPAPSESDANAHLPMPHTGSFGSSAHWQRPRSKLSRSVLFMTLVAGIAGVAFSLALWRGRSTVDGTALRADSAALSAPSIALPTP
ncbi:MAG: serine/threonine protein kinase, partial [Deltaproteobacteria bacterium HGW-Deltaproteobacteria-20]